MLSWCALILLPPHSLIGFRRFIDKIGIIGKVNLVRKAKIRHCIAMDIEDIKTRVQEVDERRRRYLPDVTMVPDRRLNIDPRVIAMFEEASSLVGIDGPAKKLINMLTQGDSIQKQKLMVVSVVGVGGLGKTTLANSVYKKLGAQFQRQAFVPVSLKPDMKNILCSILRQISRGKCKDAGEKDLSELIQNIRDFLSDKRYLIVIDDLWDEPSWDFLNTALIDNHHGSRVIVTTRNLDVGKICTGTVRGATVRGAVYELEPLSDKDSRRLLYTRVFKKEEGINTKLNEVAGKILKKCGGLPLAITTIAGLLASRKTKEEWYAVYNSICSGHVKTKDNMEKMRD
ncbi:disease resistance protein RGA5-like [Panicum virgatum]|uniref:disease resistance protein RGA5-like n=1 Tax=Panicum virgatum TaxID=38727 RepID=UPI0019D55879|nr:disease resistance protein RGA5-like [Panicum virgatum]